MLKGLKNSILILSALVIFTGALFFCCGYIFGLPRGVTVNGVDVGGMTRTAAKEKLRGCVVSYLSDRELNIYAGEEVYTFAYPEIDFTDEFGAALASIRRRGDYFAKVTYFLNGEEELVAGICASHSRAAEEPNAVFNAEGEPFTYFEGCDGVSCDGQALKEDIRASLNGNFNEVTLRTAIVERTRTVEDIERVTRKLYSYTTYFDGGNTARSANIRLAASCINGTVLYGGESFSFNAVVGERSEGRGYQRAKIIDGGKFVSGVGGGVCQVSTTLYNAAILSGLDITEYHPHSLQVGYVPPSRDAMVSGNYCDLKFTNNRATPVYIRVSCGLSSITCTVYGESDGYNYSFRSEITKILPRPPSIEVEGEDDGLLICGREGTESEGYLIAERDGEEISTLVRRDSYPAVPDTVQVKRREEG